ncbi:MAG TPA: MlaD family protein [Verrucomicrobiae bacterium]|jgi:phospholipid/cholesterol/gamma-HCH transport system substrate-binding protein|nr:MlaD family protein [Verrucomicrobiae bacterium]
MQARHEQVFVGLFVVIAAILLVVTVFALTGVFATSTRTFHARFHNAAGLEPGATVRFEGGPKIGRVENLSIVSSDPSLMDMAFSVKNDIPVKTDSHVSILSFSPLGDNHLEIRAGSAGAPRAPDGALLPSDAYVSFNDLTAEINQLTPQAKQLLTNLNDRVTQLKVTIDRVNDLLNDRNRANVASSLDNLRGMLQENRPQIKSTISNVNVAAQKLSPLLDQIKQTVDQANGTLKKVDGVVDENRADIRASVIKLHESLDNVAALTAQVQRLLDDNDYNIGEILNNLRIVSENLKQFTDSIKTHPEVLINPAMPRDRKPGEKP